MRVREWRMEDGGWWMVEGNEKARRLRPAGHWRMSFLSEARSPDSLTAPTSVDVKISAASGATGGLSASANGSRRENLRSATCRRAGKILFSVLRTEPRHGRRSSDR